MGRHVIDDLGSHTLCCADKIPLVFTILVVHDNHNLPKPDVFNRIFNGVE
jgi:hypothetical protein